MSEFEIRAVGARWILDSRGNPTVEATVELSGGARGTAAVPSGASKGEYEALELRDGDPKAFHGMGVLKAVSNVNGPIAARVVGLDARDQRALDSSMIELDGTSNKSKLGANAILAVSLACARAASSAMGMPLHAWISGLYSRAELMPVPFSNVINGGEHAGNDLSVQEFMLVPSGFNSFESAIRAVSETYTSLRSLVTRKYGPVARNVGDEGGVAPPMGETSEALNALEEAVGEAGYVAGKEISLAMDAASSTFFKDGKYRIDGRLLSPDELLSYWLDLIKSYPIVSLEDPFEQNDFANTANFTKEAKKRNVQVVGDDIFVTQIGRLKQGIQVGAGSALLLKVNQVGTLSEAVDAGLLALSSGYAVMVSHRSGETTDDFIADLAVGLGTGQIKTGAPARGERVAKYNRLLQIERESKISYAGPSLSARNG